MDNLLKPDFGLLFWTAVNFLLLVWLLGRFAWKPLVKALEDRENKIAKDKLDAENARAAAEKIKAELEARLAGISKEAQEKMRAVEAMALAEKEAVLKEAKRASAVLIDQAKVEIEAQKNAALQDVKKEIAEIAVSAAQKIAAVKVDAQADARLIKNALKDVDGKEFKA